MKYSFLLLATFWFNSIARAQVNPPAVKIGNQTWMKKNLNVTTYRNGDPIPEVKDSTAWAALTTGAWCHYNNNPANDVIYGKLYNWFAVNDLRGLAPEGWHVPSDAEWATLITTLGGENVAGNKLKETGTKHWTSTNGRSTNSSNFTGLPAGSRGEDGIFTDIGEVANWWSSTQSVTDGAWYRYIPSMEGIVYRSSPYKQDGFSIRCIKDFITSNKVTTIIQTKVNIESVKIGDQTWMKKNLDVSKFRNGEIIPEVRSLEEWIAADLEKKPAWCFYNNDPANGSKYGKLYNWFAVNDPRGLAPEGWHVPNAEEWISLQEDLGGEELSGIKMKSTSGWKDDNGKNGNGTNTSGFTGLPGGCREGTQFGDFSGINNNGMWWSATENPPIYAWDFAIYYHSDISSMYYHNKKTGRYVRCVKGNAVQTIVTTIPKVLFNPETVTIGNQTWMKKNLDITTYSNGDPIPEVNDAADWNSLTTGAWCHYNNDPANDAIYGKLYNWYAVNDPRGLAPDGWHVPMDAGWKTLTAFLGDYEEAGSKMKESGTVHWKSPNTGTTNNSGFTGLPGGYRNSIGQFAEITNFGGWWSSTELNTKAAYVLNFYGFDNNTYYHNNDKRDGLSVRLLKN